MFEFINFEVRNHYVISLQWKYLNLLILKCGIIKLFEIKKGMKIQICTSLSRIIESKKKSSYKIMQNMRI